jgi:acyl-CoA hydrolase
LDFVRDARASPGGRSILALPAAAAGGKVSRIVPRLGEREIVSCPRADADIVVTEHGIARLRDKSLAERAEALIAIAAPGFREELADGRQVAMPFFYFTAQKRVSRCWQRRYCPNSLGEHGRSV